VSQHLVFGLLLRFFWSVYCDSVGSNLLAYIGSATGKRKNTFAFVPKLWR